MSLRSKRLRNNSQLQNAADNNPPLRNGSTGSGVRILQDSLVELGYSMPITTNNGKSGADGIFGSETAKTVQAFQADERLSADGIAGRDTLHRLDGILQTDQVANSSIERMQWALCANWT